MARMRVTLRGRGIELRGYIDDPDDVTGLANDLAEAVIRLDAAVIVSYAAADYDPFKVEETADARG